MLVILLQQGKGGDIANAFGGGSSQAAFGARSGATVLSRATTVCAVLFVVGALTLGILGQRGPSSVVGGRAAPVGAGSAGTSLRPDPAPVGTQAPAPRPRRPAPAQQTPAPGGVIQAAGERQRRLPSTRKWRNWQTHQLEGLAVAIPWGFESPLPHHSTRPRLASRPGSLMAGRVE